LELDTDIRKTPWERRDNAALVTRPDQGVIRPANAKKKLKNVETALRGKRTRREKRKGYEAPALGVGGWGEKAL